MLQWRAMVREISHLPPAGGTTQLNPPGYASATLEYLRPSTVALLRRAHRPAPPRTDKSAVPASLPPVDVPDDGYARGAMAVPSWAGGWWWCAVRLDSAGQADRPLGRGLIAL